MGQLNTLWMRRLLIMALGFMALISVGCSAPMQRSYEEYSSDPYQAYISCMQYQSQYGQTYKCNQAQATNSMSFNEYVYGSSSTSNRTYEQGYEAGYQRSSLEYQMQAAWASYLDALDRQAQMELMNQWQQMSMQQQYWGY